MGGADWVPAAAAKGLAPRPTRQGLGGRPPTHALDSRPNVDTSKASGQPTTSALAAAGREQSSDGRARRMPRGQPTSAADAPGLHAPPRRHQTTASFGPEMAPSGPETAPKSAFLGYFPGARKRGFAGFSKWGHPRQRNHNPRVGGSSPSSGITVVRRFLGSSRAFARIFRRRSDLNGPQQTLPFLTRLSPRCPRGPSFASRR
jgi:hypothetical protein